MEGKTCSVNMGKGHHLRSYVMTSWWNSGFDGGENMLIGFSTQDANFYLKEPHPNYKPCEQNLRVMDFNKRLST